MYGVRYDHKLGMWVIFIKSSGKVVEKFGIEDDAKREYNLSYVGGNPPIKKWRKH